MIIGLNNQKVRHHNKQVLLALHYQLKEASKSTLARHCELSIPAVSKILDELVMPPRVLEEVAEERATLEAQLPDLFARPYVSATRYLFGDAPPAAPAT